MLIKKLKGAKICLKVDSWQHKINRELSDLKKENVEIKAEISELKQKRNSLATRTRESLETETSLISNVFEIETSLISNVFEINGELTGIKTSLESLNNEVNEIKDQQLPELRRGGGQQRQPERAH